MSVGGSSKIVQTFDEKSTLSCSHCPSFNHEISTLFLKNLSVNSSFILSNKMILQPLHYFNLYLNQLCSNFKVVVTLTYMCSTTVCSFCQYTTIEVKNFRPSSSPGQIVNRLLVHLYIISNDKLLFHSTCSSYFLAMLGRRYYATIQLFEN